MSDPYRHIRNTLPRFCVGCGCVLKRDEGEFGFCDQCVAEAEETADEPCSYCNGTLGEHYPGCPGPPGEPSYEDLRDWKAGV